MFDKFTGRARRVLVLAREEAGVLNHNYIGTEHLLLGLIAEEKGVAAKALGELGVGLEQVRERVGQILGPGTGRHEFAGQAPFTPRSRKVLELSFKEALQLGHNYIGTEHILLGLVREGEGVAAQVLVHMGADLASIREEVLKQLPASRPGRQEIRRALRSRSGRLAWLDDYDRLALRPGGPILRAIAEMGILPEEFIRQVLGQAQLNEVMTWLREGYPIAKALESFGIPLEDFRSRVVEILKSEEEPPKPDAEEPPVSDSG